MPIFEYTCRKCGVQFEALVAHADTAPACTECGSTQVDKQLSTFSAAIASGAASPCVESGCGKAGTGCGGGCPMG